MARRYAIATLLLLLPCFWQSRIQSSDLESHIYNAWLAHQIEAGTLEGLTIQFQTTNFLFDGVLTGLLETFGPSMAQRIAVAATVLIFAWGAFAFVSAVSGRRAWDLLPIIGILSYGWVFHAGFFNFYLSLGLCFFAMALAWKRTPRTLGLAAILLAIAWLAHNLPVLWTVAMLVYAWMAAQLKPARRVALLGAAMGAMIVAHVVIRSTMFALWYGWQFQLITGVDQAHIFDNKYYAISAALFLIFGLVFVELATSKGLRTVLSCVPTHLCLLTAGIVAIIPTAITGAGFQSSYISDRMSLPLAICLCALLAAVPPAKLRTYAIGATAVVFFAMLYRDHRILNQLEDRIDAAIAQAPRMVRVVNLLDDPGLHVNALTHMIDRACVGRCWSYANYEAASNQFRIRITGDTPAVAHSPEDSWRMQTGSYVVKPTDVPLYAVALDDAGTIGLQELHAGDRVRFRYWRALPDVF